ncbi:hypothetical protein AJ79_05515 [Helicocarpus griseus UAMH5409]|uniref:SPRY domain-containing protein n=1 Tax=Helicocarpus griseus UAMH5409 TaxID=1447875 RepID=A0A2B7XMK9_9EURO|nr:hypothetical protein AJ79_05515 [Helicocarpus griseus UAMH5409]
MAFLCCGRRDRDEADVPSRPVDIKATPAGKQKASRSPVASRPASMHKPTPDTSALSTADEKRRVFEPTESRAAGPSNSVMMSEGTHNYRSEPLQSGNPVSGAPPKYQAGNNGQNSLAPSDNPPPYHNWEAAVPDTAMFPPPPAGGYLYSNTGNASAEDAERAHDFCDNTPLWTPYMPSEAVYKAVQSSDLRPVRPQEYNGSLDVVGRGRWKGHTRDSNGDCILLTGLPVYFPTKDSPLVTERTKTIYFEAKLLGQYRGIDDQVSGFSIGFAAQPYPTWRSPGWERGSVGVFSDDGCRFVNDSWGGMEFTTPFKVGETVGLGMEFSLPSTESLVKAQATGTPPTLQIKLFLTRNGQMAGSWDLHEEVDEDAGGVRGLEGDFDLYGALGLFGGVKFEVCFDRAGWLWVPPAS